MRWTERQRAMLREMGVRLWWPDEQGAPTRGANAEAALAEAESPALARARPADARAEQTDDAGATAAPPRTLRDPGIATLEPIREAARVPGLAPADWLVVAEPLDPDDARQRQLLDNMLRAIGVGLLAPSRERRAVFVAVDGSGASAAAEAADRALRSALATVAPRCVLAFGRAAAAALLGAEAPLGGLRGRVHGFAGVPVVVTFSLAFLLRHPGEKAKAWADLCAAARTLATAEA